MRTQDIIYGFEGDTLLLELLIHTIDVLDSALDLKLKIMLSKLLPNPGHDVVQVPLLFLRSGVQLCLDRLIPFRVCVFEAKFLELNSEPVDAEPVSEWGIDIQGLLADPLL